MPYLSVRKIAEEYRAIRPPFHLKRDVFGSAYSSAHPVCSLQHWISFNWKFKLNGQVTPVVEEWARREGLNQSSLQKMLNNLQDFIGGMNDHFVSLSEQGRQEMKNNIIAALNSGKSGIRFAPLSPYEYPRSGDVRIVPVRPLRQPLSWGDVTGIWGKVTDIDIGDVVDGLEFIGNKVEGVAVGAFEATIEIIEQLIAEVFHIVSSYIGRLINVAELIGKGKFGDAFVGLVNSVVLLVKDIAIGVAAIALNFVVNVVAGILVGLFLGRPFTDEERGFAYGIFGNQINVLSIRIIEWPWGEKGLVAANVIFMPGGADLGVGWIRSTFAHELTHVYQDQNFARPGAGTPRASHEFIRDKLFGGKDRYELNLNADTKWNSLGAEQQGQVVENYQKHKDSPGLAGLEHYERILQEARLFEWRTFHVTVS